MIVTLLSLLDMSAAFDCVDHDLLLQRPQLGFGLTGVVLEWVCSYFTRSHAAGSLQRSGVHGSTVVIRRPRRFGFEPVAVRFVHSRTESRDCPARSVFPSVRR